MIARILEKALPKILTVEIVELILLAIALQSFTYGIVSSLRNVGGNQAMHFFWIGLIALLLAMGLSKFRLNGIWASVAIVVIGVLGVWVIGARLSSPLLALGNALLDVAPQVIPALRSDLPVNTTSVIDAWNVVAESSSVLGIRVQAWLMSLNSAGTVSDGLVRNMVWTLIVWLMAAWMGWFAGRRNAVASLLPAIALLAFITAYSEVKIYTVWLMVFVFLLLMGIWNYKEHRMQWERKKVDYSDSIRYDTGQAVIFLTIIIGAVTFVTPSISWQDIRDYLREMDKSSENEAADLLGIEPQKLSKQNSSAQKPSLPRDHLLSGGYAHSEEIVMTVRTGELPPMDNPSFTASAPRHYWRSITYDVYGGAGWFTSSAPAQRYQANTPLIPGLLIGYKVLHLDVKLEQPEGRLFWSGILFSADVPVRADWRLRPQSDLFADQSALLQADMFAAASTARAYKADVYIPRVTVEQLRVASTDYPEYILKHYLKLPTSVPDRVHKLAKEITAGKPTTYDKAKAIEAYLRTYPYDLEVPAPPEGRDVADYFLFDLKKGYCDYYATAMVVLARASGIPARFVSGYASGSYDAANAVYVVRELNAHSWAEVYFPEIGWVEFEPTASQPEVELALSTGDSTTVQPPEASAAWLLLRFRLEKAGYWLLPVLIILLACGLYFILIERWWYLRLAPATAIEKIYRRLYRLGRPLAGERAQAETAYEFMQKLINGITTLPVKERSRFAMLLYGTRQDIEVLTGMYQDTLFSDNNTQKHETKKALNTWKHLRLRLLLARVNIYLQKKLEVLSPQ